MPRTFRTKAVCWTLFVGWLVAQSLAAAADRPVVGKVVRSEGASLNGAVAPDESTIAAGDLLSTPKGGGALVSFLSGTRTSLSEDTEVRFETGPEQTRAEISSGAVVTDSLGGGVPVVETPKYTIEPVEKKATYLVAVRQDKSTVVAARRGKVSITETKSGRRYLLPGGQYITITDSASGFPADDKQADDSTAQSEGNSRLGWYIGLLPAGALVAIPGVAGSPARDTAIHRLRPKPSPH